MFQFTPDRAGGLRRLRDFLPRSATHYASERNSDRGPEDRSNVSLLSPWVRHRLLTEQEIVAAVLDRYAYGSAEKFIQEVCWRSYWKGWLEQRPQVWAAYRASLEQLQSRIGDAAEADDPLPARWRAAVEGRSGIACFDAWARELVETGYLHNHTRMWFASIWIFTLNLPWQLGAAFFLHHLLDGDPASNTLSWRWVAGLQTRGKHYLARAENIERHTQGRWNPRGELNESAAPLPPDEIAEAAALAALPRPDAALRSALWLHEDDLHPESLFRAGLPNLVAIAGAATPRELAMPVQQYAESALGDGLQRAAAHFSVPAAPIAHAQLGAWLAGQGIEQLVTPYAPIGAAADALAGVERELSALGIAVVRVLRDWDSAFWPHATRGFFQLREQIRPVLRGLGAS